MECQKKTLLQKAIRDVTDSVTKAVVAHVEHNLLHNTTPITFGKELIGLLLLLLAALIQRKRISLLKYFLGISSPGSRSLQCCFVFSLGKIRNDALATW